MSLHENAKRQHLLFLHGYIVASAPERNNQLTVAHLLDHVLSSVEVSGRAKRRTVLRVILRFRFFILLVISGSLGLTSAPLNTTTATVGLFLGEKQAVLVVFQRSG